MYCGYKILKKESVPLCLIQKYPGSTFLLIAYEDEAAPFISTCFTESGRNENLITWWTAMGKLLELE